MIYIYIYMHTYIYVYTYNDIWIWREDGAGHSMAHDGDHLPSTGAAAARQETQLEYKVPISA